MTIYDAIKRETVEAKPVIWENVDDTETGKTNGFSNRTCTLITHVHMHASKHKSAGKDNTVSILV